MNSPKSILKNGTKVVFYREICGERVECNGEVKYNNKEHCAYKTYRDLCYTILEDTGFEVSSVHHSDVQEMVMCDCGNDILEVGLDNRVYQTFTLNRKTNKCEVEYSPMDELPYTCSYCNKPISQGQYDRLRIYLDII